MTDKSKYLGHEIKWDGEQWLFCDTGLPTIGSDRFLQCGECGLGKTPEGHDGCLGTLPESIVMNACCGHGVAREAYVQFWDGSCLRGDHAANLIGVLKTAKGAA